MFKNYMASAINSFWKNKLHSAISILSLAIGVATSILIARYVFVELSYDTHWENAERIHRVNMTVTQTGRPTTTLANTYGPLLSTLKNSYGQDIQSGTRVLRIPVNINIDNIILNEEAVWVDQEFTELFEFDVLSGSIENTLVDTNSIALSEEMAIRFFGEESALNEVITITRSNSQGGSATKDYRVTAVYRLHENSVLQLPALTLIDEVEFSDDPGYLDDWISARVMTFIRIAEGADIVQITSRLAEIAADIPYAEMFDPVFRFQQVGDIQLAPVEVDEFENTGNRTSVMIFAVISVLVLLIGCINFMVLATAKAGKRAREVGVRKALGATRRQLLAQFLGEAFIITVVSVLFALVIVEVVMPLFNGLLGKTLNVPYTELSTLLFLFVLTCGVSLAGGAYPAMILSGFSPSHTLKASQSSSAGGSSLLRNILMFFQFAISIALIISTAVIYSQVYFAGSRDLGFNQENLLVIDDLSRPELVNRAAAIKQEIENLNNVISVTRSSDRPMLPSGNNLPITLLANSEVIGRVNDQETLFSVKAIDYDFFETYQIPLIAGRYYDERYASDTLPQAGEDYQGEVLQGNVIVNQRAAAQLGFASEQDAIGQVIRSIVGTAASGRVLANLSIVGIVADSQFASLRTPAAPGMYYLTPESDALSFLTVRFVGSTSSIIEAVNETWISIASDQPLIAAIVEQVLARQFEAERTEANLLTGFSMLAIAIACLGLFGVASFTVERRTKEIGLRKIMGARVRDIIRLLIWEISKPVLLANLVAWPISVWAMLNWIERFPYQIDAWLLPVICLAAGIATFTIAWLVVIGNVRKVAYSSPVKSLRYE